MKNKFYFLSIAFITILTLTSCSGDDNIDEAQVANCEEFFFTDLDFSVTQPNCINFLFQVTNFEGGIPDLVESNFVVSENGDPVGSEAGVTIVPNDEIPFSIKTVLLLDVSTSVENEINNIKQGVISLINNRAENQEIAIYTFSTSIEQQIDFSDDNTELVEAVNNIEVGSSSTNLYGSLIEASNLYTDSYELDQIEAGNIVLFTDGKDTTGASTQSSAQFALSDKDLYIVVLNGPDFDESAREVLQNFEPLRLLESNDSSQLDGLFNDVLNNIIRLSKSTYRLFFSSPKRGPNSHSLSLEFNCENSFQSIQKNFNSSSFEDGTCEIE